MSLTNLTNYLVQNEITIVAIVILAIVSAFAIWPELAKQALEWLKTVRNIVINFIVWARNLIRDIWNLDGKQAEAQKNRAKFVEKQIIKKRERLEKAIATRSAAVAKAMNLPVTLLSDEEQKRIREQVTTEFERTYGRIGKTKNDMIFEADEAATTATPLLTKEQLDLVRAQAADRFEAINGPIDPPTSPDKLTAWGTRLFYMALAFVCLFSDFIFTAARVVPLLGGSLDSLKILQGAFNQLAIITGALFVCIALLGGMLAVDEFLVSSGEYVKLHPFFSNVERWVGFALSIIMVGADLISVLILVYLSELTKSGQTPPVGYELLVFVGIALIVILGLFLSATGLLDALKFLGAFAIFLVAVTVGFAIWLFLSILSAFLTLLAAINILLMGIVNILKMGPGAINTMFAQLIALFSGRGSDDTVPRGSSGIALVGYGNGGNEWVLAICKQYMSLFGVGRHGINWVGTDSKGTVAKRALDTAIRQIGATAISVQPHSARALAEQLMAKYVASGSKDDIRPLLWVAKDTEIDECLDDLKSLENQEKFPGVRLTILWFISSQALQGELAPIARKLHEWSSSKGSILMTTLVVEQDAPFAQRFNNKYDDVAARSIASLLGGQADRYFGEVIWNMHKGNHTFSYLSVASRGAVAFEAAGTPTGRGRFGRGGRLDLDVVDAVVGEMAEAAFKDQALSTIQKQGVSMPAAAQAQNGAAPAAAQAQNGAAPAAAQAQNGAAQEAWKKQQRTGYVYMVVPPAKFLLAPVTFVNTLLGKISPWLTTKYAITAGNVTLQQTAEREDTGIDISKEYPAWAGSYYIHFTAIRNVVNQSGDAAIPSELQMVDEQQGQRAQAQGYQYQPAQGGIDG